MTRKTLALICLGLVASACGGDKGAAATDTGAGADAADGADGGDGADAGDGADGGDGGAGCPDEVPERFRNIWDCTAEACGAPVIYRYGVGSSNASGEISVDENYYIFFGGSEWCVDTFTVEGDFSNIDPTTYNCSECEETWESTWTLSTGNSCGITWGSFFKQRSDEVEGPFYGVLMFDTHSPLSGRNPDNAMLVLSATSDSSTGSLQANNSWAEGTATPSTSADSWPHDYEYVSDPMCTARSTVAGPTGRIDEIALPGTRSGADAR